MIEVKKEVCTGSSWRFARVCDSSVVWRVPMLHSSLEFILHMHIDQSQTKDSQIRTVSSCCMTYKFDKIDFAMQPEELKKAFGKRVRILRKLRDLSQEQLADSLGCSSEYISRIERGLASPSFEILNGLAKTLKVDVSALFDFSGSLSTVQQHIESKRPKIK